MLCLRGVNFHVHWELDGLRGAAATRCGRAGARRARTRETEYRLDARSTAATRFDYRNEFKAPLGPARRRRQPRAGRRPPGARGARRACGTSRRSSRRARAGRSSRSARRPRRHALRRPVTPSAAATRSSNSEVVPAPRMTVIGAPSSVPVTTGAGEPLESSDATTRSATRRAARRRPRARSRRPARTAPRRPARSCRTPRTAAACAGRRAGPSGSPCRPAARAPSA